MLFPVFSLVLKLSMKILFLLIPLSLALFAVAVFAFFWMLRHDQFRDLDSAGWRMLADDDDLKRRPR